MITIKKLPPERWKDLRDLRLEALGSDPIALGSSYEEEVSLTEHEWRQRIGNTIFALLNDKPVGMIVYMINSKLKNRHIANIFGVYVKKEVRGQRVGRQLVEYVLNLLQENSAISKIKLTVNPEQKAAVRLYEKLGFKAVGVLKNELQIHHKFYDELIMEKLL